MAVYRIYVEKQPEHATEAKALLHEIRHILQVTSVTDVRLLNRYDVEGIDETMFATCKPIVFSEPQVDITFDELPTGDYTIIASEYLPGQFDARAASCEECIQFISKGDRPLVRTARIYLLTGAVDAPSLAKIENYIINPVESTHASLDKKVSLHQTYEIPTSVPILHGFTTTDDVNSLLRTYRLAMDADDLRFCQAYFKTENRDPSLTELRMIDTYWSDHCRHTTFLTKLTEIKTENQAVKEALARYMEARAKLYTKKEKPITMMDMATIGAKSLKFDGMLTNLDISEEINACSIEIDVDINGVDVPYLLMFKNETHNHPTEIEPFGGAATCIGGAIRDPLSGRSYVYQAMRVTGAADPLVPVANTIPGKLPQRKIVTTAAQGYSAYGNQIGLATGLVDEVYHKGYAAKRLEIGAVVGATPKANVRREEPLPGDIVVLVGGRTGRDGCGGATGSSKSHTEESLESCGAEVQKGNPVVERKLQRLFSDHKVTRLIKRCNDFGAGGVSVAIGELADGLQIDLDKVPKKYEGLDGTALAISESQERMAVVLEPKDVERFIDYANLENLEATQVAVVTEAKRLQMHWQGNLIVDLCRNFLNSNGAQKEATAVIEDATFVPKTFAGNSISEKLDTVMSDLNHCSKKGLSERFDATIGAATVLMPFGGKWQLTPIQAMVAKIPLREGVTNTVSGMSYGFCLDATEQSPYHGAYYSVMQSLARLACTGFDTRKAYLTFQEYFERLHNDPKRWGKPVSALLGALDAQLKMGIASIGGKDSMSGSFEDLDVPPTLVSFAVAPGKSQDIISPEFKHAGNTLTLFACDPMDEIQAKANFLALYNAILEKKVLSAWAVGDGGILEGVAKMALGNHIGATITTDKELFTPMYTSFVLEMKDGETLGEVIGQTHEDYSLLVNGETICLAQLQDKYEGKLHKVFPYLKEGKTVSAPRFEATTWAKPAVLTNKPVAFVPVFPGTNCEFDTARALERAGAKPELLLINNLTPAHIAQSMEKAEELIKRSQMIVLPGGFSGGDEPDGSAKFINAFFRNSQLMDAIHTFLNEQDGLMLGICNGFQALIKLGLLPFGKIVQTDAQCPTLTYNAISRHQSMLVNTRIASNKSPWLMNTKVDDRHLIAISHGEGRFVATQKMYDSLVENGQIATQYVDLDGNPTMDMRFNPNGSFMAVEGIQSPDGRILGKMGHTERSGNDLYKNVMGDQFQPLFESGVKYFK